MRKTKCHHSNFVCRQLSMSACVVVIGCGRTWQVNRVGFSKTPFSELNLEFHKVIQCHTVLFFHSVNWVTHNARLRVTDKI